MMKEAKAYETKVAVDSGADEIDMVINVGFLKSKKIDLFERDIKKVRDACHASVLKVIIETCLLTDEEKVLACKIAKNAELISLKLLQDSLQQEQQNMMLSLCVRL